METKSLNSVVLISAICNLSSDIPLSSEEQSTFEEFIKKTPELNELAVNRDMLLRWAAYQLDVDKKWQQFQNEYADCLQLDSRPETPRRIWPMAIKIISIVASAIIMINIVFYSLLLSGKHPQPDIAAAVHKATLVLANNEVIALETLPAGYIIQQGNTRIIKQDSSMLSVERTAGATSHEAALYNQLLVPRGSMFSLKLPDGSVVDLNAETSIRFPGTFSGRNREVVLEKGEACFNIRHDPSNPFIVSGNGIRYKVLGTIFTIKAYNSDTLTRTTLIKGALEISTGCSNVLLHPGQQAVVQPNKSILVISNVNTSNLLAWKTGEFFFENDDLRSIMTEAESWYNIKATFKDHVNAKGIVFQKISRNVPVKQFMNILSMEEKAFHYEIRQNDDMTEVVISK